MKYSISKDTFREIRRTLSRFLSIFFISALGVSFFAGIKATSRDMKITADKYFDEYNLMDIRLLSTIGFNNDDINAVKKLDGIEGIMPAYSMDALVNIEDREFVLKVISILPDKLNNPNQSYINRLKLIEGRYPAKPGECVAEKGKIIDSGISIGSKIKLASGTDKDINESLKVNDFEIVGIVETPYYISFERGTSSIGNGSISSFIMIPEEDFKYSVYTDMFLTVKGAKGKESYEDSYMDVINPVKDSIETIGEDRVQTRYSEILSDARDKLDRSRGELADAEEEQRIQLEKASREIESSRKEIINAEKLLKNKKSEFNKTILEVENKIKDGYKKLYEGESQYAIQLRNFQAAKEQAGKGLEAAEVQIAAGQVEINKGEKELNDIKLALSENQSLSQLERTAMEEKVKTIELQLNAYKDKLAASKAEFEGKKKDLAEGEEKLKESRRTLDASKTKLVSESIKLEESKRKAVGEFAMADKELESSREKLNKGEQEFDNKKNESDEMLADARGRIEDGERELGKLEKPVWYVLDRNTNPGFVDYGNASDSMDAIAGVFPVIFFLVAALVCLTTMTRMVDEQRVYIGTYKALGYSKASIAAKYLLYAALASVSGSIFGFTLGFKIFPTVIFNAYRIMYTLPDVVTAFNTSYAVISTASAVAVTTMAAWFACYSELKASPAALMRPKSPKPGKRIFLERISPIWSRFDFIKKITARNLFRYKKRFFMTLIGIGGCTALLLTGFGLKDSIMSIVTKQFEELYRYDMVLELKGDLDTDTASGIKGFLSGDDRISDYMFVRRQNIDAGSDKKEKSVSMIIPESTEKMKDFIVLRERTTGREVPFSEDGVILTEKLAKQLQVQVGDEIYIKNDEGKRVDVKVRGITENYVSHYVYMPSSIYKKVYNQMPEYQQIYAKTTDTSESFENGLSRDMISNPDISSVAFTTGISKDFADIIGSLNYVVLVLIFSAGALAFVVLYNLTNINVMERLREIATIKVLGFYDNEVSAYVYRENLVLTLLGTILGLVLGILLHKFIIVTAEVDYVMFGRDIKPLSYVFSAVLTMLFSCLVNFVMYYRLKRIDMVESLKSVD